jgi:hypothetical protein
MVICQIYNTLYTVYNVSLKHPGTLIIWVKTAQWLQQRRRFDDPSVAGSNPTMGRKYRYFG